jgi:hypothetical protein
MTLPGLVVGIRKVGVRGNFVNALQGKASEMDDVWLLRVC